MIEGTVRDKVLKKLRAINLPQNQLKVGFEQKSVALFDSLLQLSYIYYSRNKTLPVWPTVLEVCSKGDNGVGICFFCVYYVIVKKESVVSAIMIYFGSIVKEEGVSDYCTAFEAIGKGIYGAFKK